jgi:hypothetical protein
LDVRGNCLSIAPWLSVSELDHCALPSHCAAARHHSSAPLAGGCGSSAAQPRRGQVRGRVVASLLRRWAYSLLPPRSSCGELPTTMSPFRDIPMLWLRRAVSNGVQCLPSAQLAIPLGSTRTVLALSAWRCPCTISITFKLHFFVLVWVSCELAQPSERREFSTTQPYSKHAGLHERIHDYCCIKRCRPCIALGRAVESQEPGKAFVHHGQPQGTRPPLRSLE